MKYIDLISFNKLLEKFQKMKVPFSICITKNSKNALEYLTKYDEIRYDIIQKYASVDENGKLLGKVKEDGTRVENPQTLDALEIEDIQGLVLELNKLDLEETEFEVLPIDMQKSYYNTELNEKSTVEEFIDTNLEPELISAMAAFGLIEL